MKSKTKRGAAELVMDPGQSQTLPVPVPVPVPVPESPSPTTLGRDPCEGPAHIPTVSAGVRPYAGP